MERKYSKRKMKSHLSIVRALEAALKRMSDNAHLAMGKRFPGSQAVRCEVYTKNFKGYVDSAHRSLEKNDYRGARKKVNQADKAVDDLIDCARTHEDY